MNIMLLETEMKQLHKDCEYYRKKRTSIALLRFLVFIGMIASLFYAYYQTSLFYGVSLVLLGAFLGLIYYHDKIKKMYFYLSCQYEVIEDMKKRKLHEWTAFENTGEVYIGEHDYTAKDLDIFGHASLFQYLNCTATPGGEAMFANWLKEPTDDETIRLNRQKTIIELQKRFSFVKQYLTYSKIFARQKQITVQGIMKVCMACKERKEVPFWFHILRIVSPLILLVGILLSVFQLLPWQLLFAWFTLQVAISMAMRGMCDEQLALLSHTQALMDVYQQMFACLETEQFTSKRLQELHQNTQGASIAVRKLSTLIGFTNARNNDITYLIGSGLFLMDLHFVYHYEKWKRQYGSMLEQWMQSAGEVEALLSLAMLPIIRDDVCVPVFQTEMGISFDALKHPLLDETKAIPNQFSLHQGTCVITGSNMSGKTTFLRTIGLNMVLANAGGMVCAKTWKSPCLDVYTSMRVEDNVDRGISTFYAEIMRIKMMMEASKKQRPMLVLIDEIFKGTNSADRIVGAQEAVKRLHVPGVITFVSTHDFELCALETDPTIHACNMHFSEYYENDEIHFDYVLRVGRCVTTNARHLMRLAGII